jgi:hypothetical protein
MGGTGSMSSQRNAYKLLVEKPLEKRPLGRTLSSQRNTYKILVGKPQDKRPYGRPRFI